jgi:hypothetical protein
VKQGEQSDRDDGATHALDLVDQWDRGPTWREIHAMQDRSRVEINETVAETRWISMTDVAGVTRENIDRFEHGRVRDVLELLVEERFNPDHDRRPHYLNINGDLYVGADGIHRTIALKATDVKEIKADVDTPDVPKQEYERWTDRRDRGALRPLPGDPNSEAYIEQQSDDTSGENTDRSKPNPDEQGLFSRLHGWLGK